MPDTVKVVIDFTEDTTPYGLPGQVFSDALIYTREAYDALTGEQIATAKAERVQAFVDLVLNPPPPPDSNPSPRILTPYGFLSRFTLEEQAGMSALTLSSDPQVASIAMALDRVLRVAGEINLDEDVTVQGLGFLAQCGVITEERVAQILA